MGIRMKVDDPDLELTPFSEDILRIEIGGPQVVSNSFSNITSLIPYTAESLNHYRCAWHI